MSNLQTYYHFKQFFQKVYQNKGSEWLIHCNKRRTGNQLQSQEPHHSPPPPTPGTPVKYPECKLDIKESEANMFIPIFKENVQGRKHPRLCAFAEPECLVTGSLKCSSKVMNGHKNPIDSHKYHDASHDEIEFYQGNINRST